jgi:pimeloyl-ACP methyl ester carboxylesterase
MRPSPIEIPQADIDDLRDRLKRTRLAGAVVKDWDRGVPRDYLADLIAYWADRFDWRAQERLLNGFGPTETEIDGQRIHFLHVRSSEPNALPLLITHGYPSSVAEFTKLIEPLVNPQEPSDAFHVIIPSLPGYGLSTPLAEPGWQVARTARAWVELMRRLGYERYGTHGGDIGAGIAGMVGGLDREHVVGVHVVTDLTGAAMSAGTFVPVDLDALNEDEKAHLAALKERTAGGTGYLQLQSTRPQTVGYGLVDSPAFQLAWIAEKFKEWTQEPVDVDQLLTNVALYWFPGNGWSAANFLYEAAHSYDWGDGATNPHQGWAMFGGKDPLIGKLFNPDGKIGHWTEYDEGGHFPAMECPQLLAEDLRTFFRPFRK